MLDSLFVPRRGKSHAAQHYWKARIIRALQRFTVCENAYGNGWTAMVGRPENSGDSRFFCTPDAKLLRRLHAHLDAIVVRRKYGDLNGALAEQVGQRHARVNVLPGSDLDGLGVLAAYD